MTPDPREPYGRIVHGIRLAFNADLPHPRGVLPWEEREAGQQEMDMRIGAAVAAAERGRIRTLADRNNAVCTGDEGTSCYFSALLAEPQERTDEKGADRG